MEYEGVRTIPAPREAVWELLTDPDTLRSCIEGAEQLKRSSETVYEGVISQQVGGLTVSLEGRLRFEELQPPERLAFSVNGTDARTDSRLAADVEVTLSAEGPSTELAYHVEAVFSGRLGTFGSRILTRQVRTNLETFLDNLVAQVPSNGQPPRRGVSSESPTGSPDGR